VGLGRRRRPVSEAQLQKAVIELAQLLGWRVAHFRPAMTQSGRWVTAVQGNGKGFPDLVLAKNGYVLFVELKSAKGRLSAEQEEWLEVLPPEDTYVWRPEQWTSGAIERVLRAYTRAAA
jgi:hypothetical protein